ncbi:hypothetical protein O6H91_18G006500 [Diphasiastrum complanatum]|uniref:Uncharacterized protein n=1 Tax=Diphasiastrum complanatum TaxID=34168 RepID=A0ACC2AZ37_DIPCM|nr:hypothetical protein O6H91_18G006500 [Diphasiastrum complanatum]
MENQDLQEALNNLSVEVNLLQLLRLLPLVRRKEKHMMKPSALRTLDPPIIGHISAGTLDRACPKVDVTIDGLVIVGAIVDVGSAVNILSSELVDRLGFELEPVTLTTLKLANNSVTKLDGELKHTPITVAGKTTYIDFYVIKMHPGSRGYSILLIDKIVCCLLK